MRVTVKMRLHRPVVRFAALIQAFAVEGNHAMRLSKTYL